MTPSDTRRLPALEDCRPARGHVSDESHVERAQLVPAMLRRYFPAGVRRGGLSAIGTWTISTRQRNPSASSAAIGHLATGPRGACYDARHHVETALPYSCFPVPCGRPRSLAARAAASDPDRRGLRARRAFSDGDRDATRRRRFGHRDLAGRRSVLVSEHDRRRRRVHPRRPGEEDARPGVRSREGRGGALLGDRREARAIRPGDSGTRAVRRWGRGGVQPRRPPLELRHPGREVRRDRRGHRRGRRPAGGRARRARWRARRRRRPHLV